MTTSTLLNTIVSSRNVRKFSRETVPLVKDFDRLMLFVANVRILGLLEKSSKSAEAILYTYERKTVSMSLILAQSVYRLWNKKYFLPLLAHA